MPARHPAPAVSWDRMIHAMRTEPGSVDAEHRAAVVERIAERADVELTATVAAYVDKVATASYKVVERDLQALRDEGLSDGAILELTLTAAAASADRGVQAVRRALTGQEARDVAK